MLEAIFSGSLVKTTYVTRRTISVEDDRALRWRSRSAEHEEVE